MKTRPVDILRRLEYSKLQYITGPYPVPVDKVMHAYYKRAFGYLTGQVFRVEEPSTQYLRK